MPDVLISAIVKSFRKLKKPFVPAFQIMDILKLDCCIELLHDIYDALNTVKKLGKDTFAFVTLF